jgi:hypothetical protein
MGRKIAWVVSLVLLFLSGLTGIYDGITELEGDETLLQMSVTVGVFLYGVFGLVTAYGLFRRRRWSVVTAIIWGVVVAYVPGAAVMAFGGRDAFLSSAIGASAGSAILAFGVVWTARAVVNASSV